MNLFSKKEIKAIKELRRAFNNLPKTVSIFLVEPKALVVAKRGVSAEHPSEFIGKLGKYEPKPETE